MQFIESLREAIAARYEVVGHRQNATVDIVGKHQLSAREFSLGVGILLCRRMRVLHHIGHYVNWRKWASVVVFRTDRRDV